MSSFRRSLQLIDGAATRGDMSQRPRRKARQDSGATGRRGRVIDGRGEAEREDALDSARGL